MSAERSSIPEKGMVVVDTARVIEPVSQAPTEIPQPPTGGPRSAEINRLMVRAAVDRTMSRLCRQECAAVLGEVSALLFGEHHRASHPMYQAALRAAMRIVDDRALELLGGRAVGKSGSDTV